MRITILVPSLASNGIARPWILAQLLARHYDPTYARAIARNFPHHDEALVVAPTALDPEAFRALARILDESVRARALA